MGKRDDFAKGARAMRIALYLIGCVFLAVFVACSGGGASTVTAPRTPQQSPSGPQTLEQKLSALPDAEQAYARAAINGIVGPLDPRTMRVGNVGTLSEVTVFQVASADSFLAESAEQLFLVQGMPTANLVDGRSYNPSGIVFIVSGTQRYITALGSTKQVLVLNRVNSPAADAIVQEERSRYLKSVSDYESKKSAEQEESERESYRRTWTSKDKQFSVDAYFLSQGGGKINLQRVGDGREITVSTSILVPDDVNEARLMTLRKKKAEK